MTDEVGGGERASMPSDCPSISTQTVDSFYTAENGAALSRQYVLQSEQQRREYVEIIFTSATETRDTSTSEALTSMTLYHSSDSNTTASLPYLRSSQSRPIRREPSGYAASPGSTYDNDEQSHSKQSLLSRSDGWAANFWCVVTDPFSSANTFFANPQTGECRWTLPAGSIVLPPTDRGEWWEVMDERTGQEYYYHTRTQESRWSRPDQWEGLIIPMFAIQRSTHVTAHQCRWHDVVAVGQLGDLSSDRRVDWMEEKDHDVVITTPLRPRTKSLPKIAHKTLRKASIPQLPQPSDQHLYHQAIRSPTGLSKSQIAGQSLTQKARRSILIHDQKVLELARQHSGPPFRPDPTIPSFPVAATTKQQRRSKISLTKRSARKQADVVTGHINASQNPGQSRTNQTGETMLASPVAIRRLGKGFAFDPSTPPVAPQKRLKLVRSMPSLSGRTNQVPAGPPSPPSRGNLTKTSISCFASKVHTLDPTATKYQRKGGSKSSLTTLLRSFTPRKRHQAVEPASQSWSDTV